MFNKIVISWVSILCFTILLSVPCLADNGSGINIGEKVREPVRESVEIRKQTQAENEAWQKDKEELIVRYDRLQEENRRLAAKEAGLEKAVAATGKRIERKERQLADIEQITEGINPFLYETIDRIAQLANESMPFLMEERTRRLNNLHKLMDDPEVSTSERFRKVMEALLVEAEYGNTIEVYQETISVPNPASGAPGRTMLVNIFRLGRISLFYQTMDQQESGWFDTAGNQWDPLPKTHNRAIASAINIGAKRQPVELLTLPLGRMVVR
jgi:hypothetical protein